MRVSRLFLDQKISQHVGSLIEVADKDRVHYIKNVLRLKSKDPLTIFNGEGGEFICSIDQIDKKSLSLLIEGYAQDNRALSANVTIGMCVTKRDAMDTAIQKATELGVETIVPLISDRVSVATKQIQSRQSHWQSVAISACEQCGLNQIPKLSEPMGFSDWIVAQSGTKFLADVDGLTFQAPVKQSEDRVVLLVGPEGGLTDAEVQQATQNNFISVNLGERILRAETAAISLMTLVNQSLVRD